MNLSLTRFRRLIPSSIRAPLLPLRQLSLPAKVGGEEEEEAPPEPIDQRRLPADYDPATFDPAEHRSPPSSRVFRLVDEVASLTLSEVSELSAILVCKLGLKGPPNVAVMKPGAAAFAGGTTAAAPKEEEKVDKTVFELKLESFDAASKLKVIKEVRALTDLGLKEAKDLVEKAPAVFKAGVSKEEGEGIVEKLKAVGAKVLMV